MELHPKRKHGITVLGLAMASLLGLVGCAGNASTPAESSGATELTKITIGLPIPASTLTPIYVAEAKGFFAEQGLDATILTFKGDGPLVTSVLSGDVDIAVGSLSGVITSVQAGQDVKAFYGGFNMPGFSWYATPEITSFAQGKGKNWGITTIASSTDLLTRFVVSEEGFDPDTDVNIIQAGTSPARMAAMSAGSLQVSILSDPTTFAAERAGFNKILDLKDVVSDYPMHVAWSTGAFLENNPDTVKKFVAALSEGMQYTIDNQEDAALILTDAAKLEASDSLPSIQAMVDYLHPDGRMVTNEGLDAFFQMSLDGGLFDSRPNSKVWLDTTYLPAS